jgi:RNA-binding protein
MAFTKGDDVGEIMHLARSGRLIVKLNTTGADKVRPGELLIDRSGKKVGRVVELLGPVSTPYASVLPMTDRTGRLVGSRVFSGGSAKMPQNYKKRSRRSNLS